MKKAKKKPIVRDFSDMDLDEPSKTKTLREADAEEEAKLLANAKKVSAKFRQLRKTIKESPDLSDTSQRDLHQALLDSTLAIIPVAFKQYMAFKNESALYAYNGAANQAKDLTMLLRSFADNEQQAQYIASNIVAPIMVSAAQQLMVQVSLIKQNIDSAKLPEKGTRKIKSDLDNMLRDYAKFLQGASDASSERVIAYMTTGSVSQEKSKKEGRKKPRTREKS